VQFRKIDDERSMRSPAIEDAALVAYEDGFDYDFECDEGLVADADLTGSRGDGAITRSALRDSDLTEAHLSPVEVVDTVIDHCVLSNGRWERLTARRVEVTGCQLVGWQAQFAMAEDVYVADCRADFAGISIGAAKGLVVFERCRFAQASFLGDLSRAVFVDCEFPGADFARVSSARGCDLRRSNLSGVNGLMSLRGSLITADQAVAIAGELAVAAGFRLA
jgi:uncharacterized protein YjbI with pentapeptide repeats